MFCPDKEKTTFITSQGLYCYNIMLLGLKNAGATYQRLITKIFKPLMGWTMEVYIDDIIAKSKTCTKHMQHLEKAFALIRKCNKKLNPLKCAFGVKAGKFLGFLVTQWGIKINQDQVKVVLETLVRSTKKEIQRLTGRLAALGWFITQFTNKLCPFFTTLCETQKFGWTDNCNSAFDVIKHCLIEPPILSSLEEEEELYMYLVVSNYVVSIVMF